MAYLIETDSMFNDDASVYGTRFVSVCASAGLEAFADFPILYSAQERAALISSQVLQLVRPSVHVNYLRGR